MRIEPITVLRGTLADEVVMAWEAYVTEDGERSLEIVSNGLHTPDVGDELLLFLVEEDPARAEFFGGEVSYRPLRLDGVLALSDGRVESGATNSAIATSLVGLTVHEVGELLAAGS